MSFMQTVRDGRRRCSGIPGAFKVIAGLWIAVVLGMIGTVIWVAAHFIAKFW